MLLTHDADIAAWSNQGLPSDRMSIENATILCNTERWPLIVDAQLQGIKWIKNKYGDHLKVIRLGQKGSVMPNKFEKLLYYDATIQVKLPFDVISVLPPLCTTDTWTA